MYHKLTVKEIETDGVLESIIEKYEQGDKTVYEIFYDNETSSKCILTPYSKELHEAIDSK